MVGAHAFGTPGTQPAPGAPERHPKKTGMLHAFKHDRPGGHKTFPNDPARSQHPRKTPANQFGWRFSVSDIAGRDPTKITSFSLVSISLRGIIGLDIFPTGIGIIIVAQIDRLLGSLVTGRVSLAALQPDQAIMLDMGDGNTRPFNNRILSARQVEGLLDEIMPDFAKESLRDSGRAEFEYDSAHGPVGITALRRRDQLSVYIST